MQKVADEKDYLISKHNKEHDSKKIEVTLQEKSSPYDPKDALTKNETNYCLDYLKYSKFQFLFLIDNIIFFFLLKNIVYLESNYPEGFERCFYLRTWSSLLGLAYLVGIHIRLYHLFLMGIVISYKKRMNEKHEEPEEKKTDPKALEELTKKRVYWNLKYKYLVEKRDLFLGLIIVLGIFLLVGITIATTHEEPCGKLRSLALFWIYIYNIVFVFFPITMLIMCLYPYNIACKFFSGFLRFYSLQLNIFDNKKN